MDDLKKTTHLAVASSFALAGVLLLVGQPEAMASLLIRCVSVLVLTYVTITTWVACAREYIDHAIDRGLATNDREAQ
jgi:hypothetical protein